MGPNARVIGGGLVLALLSNTPALNQVSTPTPILRPVPAVQGLQYTLERNNETYVVSVTNPRFSYGNIIGNLRLARAGIGTDKPVAITEFEIRDMILSSYEFGGFHRKLNTRLLDNYRSVISAKDAEALFEQAFNYYSTLDDVISQ
mgnify:CR=1 FL=1